MATPPMTQRRIRQLPSALPASDADVFPVSQMDPNTGIATTRQMTRTQLQSDLVEVINAARQQFVDQSNTEHQRLQSEVDSLSEMVQTTVMNDAQMQAALVMLQQMVNGESGKTPYDLWLEAGNTGSMSDFLASLRGPQGAVGPRGEQGPQGEKGATGDAGAIGPQGPSGLKGDKGDRGETGTTGPQGPAGNQGRPGNDGATGSQGPAGPKGDTGATGAKGDTGATGLKGDIGAKGDVGQQGAAGTPGAVILGEIDVVDQAVVALNLGVRTKDITVPVSWGLKTTDTLFVTPVGSPAAGYSIDNAIPLTTTSIRVIFVGPALALLASNTVRIRVAAIAR